MVLIPFFFSTRSILCRSVRRPKSPRGPGRRWLALATALSLGVLGLLRGQAPEQSSAPAAQHHVVVVSIDGMRASFYTDPPKGSHIPNLMRLMKEGSYATGVEGVYPTLTYPSHTTIVTGRLPAEHGIYTNLSSRQAGKNPGDWFWFSQSIKTPTLWDEARRAHLSTASVSWPVTAGAGIDWDVPEIWDPQKGEVVDPLYLAKYMNPLFSMEILAAVGGPQGGKDGDADRTRLAMYLLRIHKPNLLLVHLATLDDTEHLHGPESPEAAATLGRVDTHIGEILAALKEAGLETSTDIFIVSDHGFMSIDREIAPNVLLAKAGLLTADEKGAVSGGKIDTVANGGSFFIYWPQSEDLRAQVDAALKPLRDRGLLWAEIDRDGLKELGADTQAQLALEAPRGALFSDAAKGELVSRSSGGTHGFLPFRSGLEASFIAWGPKIKSGVQLHRIRMTAVGPTILKSMGIDDPQFGDQPALEDIFRKQDSEGK